MARMIKLCQIGSDIGLTIFLSQETQCKFPHLWEYITMVKILLMYTRALRDGKRELLIFPFRYFATLPGLR